MPGLFLFDARDVDVIKFVHVLYQALVVFASPYLDLQVGLKEVALRRVPVLELVGAELYAIVLDLIDQVLHALLRGGCKGEHHRGGAHGGNQGIQHL